MAATGLHLDLGQVEVLGGQGGPSGFGLELGPAVGHGLLDDLAGLVEGLAHGATLVGLEPTHLLLVLGQRTGFAQHVELDLVQLVQAGGGSSALDRTLGQALDLVDHRQRALSTPGGPSNQLARAPHRATLWS